MLDCRSKVDGTCFLISQLNIHGFKKNHIQEFRHLFIGKKHTRISNWKIKKQKTLKITHILIKWHCIVEFFSKKRL